MSKRKIVFVLVIVGLVSLTPATKAQAEHIRSNMDVAPIAPVCRVETSQKIIALTFDDGPDPQFTPAVLEMLQQTGAKATFFMIGEQAAAHPDLVARVHDEGNEIANHTWDHPLLQTVSPARVQTEAEQTSALLAPTAKPSLFRAPLGIIDKDQIDVVQSSGLKPLHWSSSIDHLTDGKDVSAQAAAARLVAEAQPGGIILAHDAPGVRRAEALAALQIAIPQLKAQGYTVTTASAVLAAGKPVRSHPRLGYWQSGFYCEH